MSFHVRTGPGNSVQTPTGSSLALAVEAPHAGSLGWLVYVILSAKHARLLMVDFGAVLQAVEVSSCTTAEAEAAWVQAASVYVVNVTLVAVVLVSVSVSVLALLEVVLLPMVLSAHPQKKHPFLSLPDVVLPESHSVSVGQSYVGQLPGLDGFVFGSCVVLVFLSVLLSLVHSAAHSSKSG